MLPYFILRSLSLRYFRYCCCYAGCSCGATLTRNFSCKLNSLIELNLSRHFTNCVWQNFPSMCHFNLNWSVLLPNLSLLYFVYSVMASICYSIWFDLFVFFFLGFSFWERAKEICRLCKNVNSNVVADESNQIIINWILFANKDLFSDKLNIEEEKMSKPPSSD